MCHSFSFGVTDLHEEEAGAAGGVGVHVDGHEDGSSHNNYHHDDTHQQPSLQPLVALCGGVLVSGCTERVYRL